MNCFFLLVAFAAISGAQAQKNTSRFYIGTGAKGTESSITLCELNLRDGSISVVDTFNQCVGPGYLALSPDRRNLYAVTQDHTIAAFAVGRGGTLTYLNRQPSEGVNPCHVSVAPSGRMAFLANYGSGSWTAYPLSRGRVQPPAATFGFSGSGPDKSRQEKPHAHCVVPSPDGRFVYVADLGTDRLMNYRLDQKTGKITPNPDQPYFPARPGAGPRHFAFHPSGRYLYLLNEMKATVVACAVDAGGVVTEIETLNTLPADFQGRNTAAAIHLHPNGRFVYVSNRGYNAIHAYEIQENGGLKSVGEVREGIDTPRDFMIDPSGKYMVVGNQKTNDLVVYGVDPASGRLTFLHRSIARKDPICFVFLD